MSRRSLTRIIEGSLFLDLLLVAGFLFIKVACWLTALHVVYKVSQVVFHQILSLISAKLVLQHWLTRCFVGFNIK
jgi:hypothetical protein